MSDESLAFTLARDLEEWCRDHGTIDRLDAIRAKLPLDLGGTGLG